MNTHGSVKLAVAATLFGFASIAQAVVIDDFDVGAQGAVFGSFNSGSPLAQSGSERAPVVNIIGGERDIFVASTAGGTGTTVRTGPDAVNGSYAHSQGVGTFGYSLVSWDGVDATAGANPFGSPATIFQGGGAIDSTVGLGGLDLIADGSLLNFELSNFSSSDTNDAVNISFLVFSSDTAYSSLTVSLIGTSTGTVFNIDTADFVQGTPITLLDGITQPQFLPTTMAQSEADFTNVTAIALLVDGTVADGLDVAISLLEVRDVPVAPSAMMLLLGLGGLATRKRMTA